MEIANPSNPKRSKPVRLLVDSGAIHSVVAGKTLRSLGIKPLQEQEFTLANGDKIRRKKGVALFKYQDKIGGADVIFGEEGDSNLLWAFTLEALGFALC